MNFVLKFGILSTIFRREIVDFTTNYRDKSDFFVERFEKGENELLWEAEIEL